MLPPLRHKPGSDGRAGKAGTAFMRRRQVGALVRRMAVEISPEPSDEERKAILEALEEEHVETAAPSPWRAKALGSGGRAAAPESWRDAGIVEP